MLRTAIWPTSGDTAAGSFDSAEDFSKNDVIIGQDKLINMPIWLDNGDKDWFLDGAAAFEFGAQKQNLTLTKNIWPGDHKRQAAFAAAV